MEEIPSVIRKGGLSLIYYGLTAFISMLVSLIATRKLEPTEFGTYQFLVIYASFFNLGVNSLGWFLTRFIARGYDVRKEAIKIGLPLILVSDLLLFISLVFVSKASIALNFNLVLLTFLLFLTQSLFLLIIGAIQGIDVSIVYMGNLIQAISRLFLLFVGIYILFEKLSVEFFILVILIANLIATIFLITKFLKFKGIEQRGSLINTFKRFWYVPFLNSLFVSMIIYDSVLMTILLSSTITLAFFRSAYIIASVVGYIQVFVQAYYREFLEKDSIKGLTQAIKVLVLLSAMITFLIMSIGDLLLAILRPLYVSSYLPLILLSISFFMGNMASLFGSSILSLEKTDLYTSERSFKNTQFYTVTKVLLYQTVFQYTGIIFLAYLSKIFALEPVVIAVYWSLVWLMANILTFSLYYKKLRDLHLITFPSVSVGKYVVISMISSIITYIMKPRGISANLFSQFFISSLYALIYLAIFFSLLLLLDENIRKRVIRISLSLLK
jgi:hypothetical protein